MQSRRQQTRARTATGARTRARPARRRIRLTAGERRARILAAATEVFARRGYEAASMGEIARLAGVVPSVIYDHFASKRELHAQLLDHHTDAVIARAVRRVEGPPAELFAVNVEAFFAVVEEDRFAWRFIFREPPAEPALAELHRRLQDRATDAIAALLEATGPPDVTIGDIPRAQASRMAAKAVQSALNGLAEWWYEHPEVPRRQVVAVARRLLWPGLAAFTEPPSSER